MTVKSTVFFFNLSKKNIGKLRAVRTEPYNFNVVVNIMLMFGTTSSVFSDHLGIRTKKYLKIPTENVYFLEGRKASDFVKLKKKILHRKTSKELTLPSAMIHVF